MADGVAAVKADHGGSHLALGLAGGANSEVSDILADRSLITRVDDSNRYFEIELVKGGDPQALLHRIVATGAEINRFEIVHPSLHQIFLERVGATGIEAGMTGHG